MSSRISLVHLKNCQKASHVKYEDGGHLSHEPMKFMMTYIIINQWNALYKIICDTCYLSSKGEANNKLLLIACEVLHIPYFSADKPRSYLVSQVFLMVFLMPLCGALQRFKILLMKSLKQQYSPIINNTTKHGKVLSQDLILIDKNCIKDTVT